MLTIQYLCIFCKSLRLGPWNTLSSRRGNTIIGGVKAGSSHPCRLIVPEALAIQQRLAGRISKNDEIVAPRLIAGVDISAKRGSRVARAAAVVLSYPGLEMVETRTAEGQLDFPYIPGLLSFREAPLSVAACNSLSVRPDLFLIDGQGVAHPRRFGLACHIGLLLDKPAIGCAKSLLCGRYDGPGPEQGVYAEISDNGEIIGAVLRTKRGTKPVYVSIGHKVDLPGAIKWVTQSCRGYRIPEPLRLAHIAAGNNHTGK